MRTGGSKVMQIVSRFLTGRCSSLVVSKPDSDSMLALNLQTAKSCSQDLGIPPHEVPRARQIESNSASPK